MMLPSKLMGGGKRDKNTEQQHRVVAAFSYANNKDVLDIPTIPNLYENIMPGNYIHGFYWIFATA